MIFSAPYPQSVDENAVDFQNEQVHLEVVLFEHGIEEVEEESHLGKKWVDVFHSADCAIQLLGA